VIETLAALARQLAGAAMLAATHGQPASPTTLGKELANVVHRLRRGGVIASVSIVGKINGAVGNYNAHVAAYPDFDWEGFARRSSSLSSRIQPLHIQIEPHDSFAEQFDAFAAPTPCSSIWTAICGYISLATSSREESGRSRSSTMRTRSIPSTSRIRGQSRNRNGCCDIFPRSFRCRAGSAIFGFDGAEEHRCRARPQLLAYESCQKGLGKLEADAARMLEDSTQLEVLGEAVCRR